jgi:alanine-alpha-ketoisovalerate/valine-pyruvate aminotransferase
MIIDPLYQFQLDCGSVRLPSTHTQTIGSYTTYASLLVPVRDKTYCTPVVRQFYLDRACVLTVPVLRLRIPVSQIVSHTSREAILTRSCPCTSCIARAYVYQKLLDRGTLRLPNHT